MLSSRIEQILVGLTLSSLIFFAVLTLRNSGQLQPFDFIAYDSFVKLSINDQPSSSPISIVAITEADIQHIQRWPITDQMLVTLLEKLLSFQPIAIGVDIYRDLPVPPGTAKLTQLLEKHPSLVMIERFGDGHTHRISPPPVLQSTDQVGFSDIPIDQDGIVRRGLLFLDDYQAAPHYALSLRLALRYLAEQNIFAQPDPQSPDFLKLGHTTYVPFEKNDGAYINADASGYQYWLNFKTQNQTFQRYTLQQILHEDVPSAAFQDKIVLIGVISDSVKDDFFTPLDRSISNFQSTPGVLLHALMTHQLIESALFDQPTLSPVSEWGEQIWIIFWCLFALTMSFYTATWWQFMLASSVGTLILLSTAFTSYLAGFWLPVASAMLAWFGTLLPVTAYVLALEKGQRKLLMDIFSRHVSKDIAQEIWRQRKRYIKGRRLTAHKMTVTVLFSDLEDFTPLAERLQPGELMQWLTEYTDQMAGIVMRHHGVVDDFYGDAIKAEFGIPIARTEPHEIKQDAINALLCAKEMADEMKKLNEKWQNQGLPEIRMRIGIATGEVIAGTLGNIQRLKYTTIGDVINTAARLEDYGKSLRSHQELCTILLSNITADLVQQDIPVEWFGELTLKGKSQRIPTYRLVPEDRTSSETSESW